MREKENEKKYILITYHFRTQNLKRKKSAT